MTGPPADLVVDDRPPLFVEREGRRIAWQRYGAEAGRPVLFFHGGPGSRLEGALFDEAGRELGVSVFAFDRPGLGASDIAGAVTLESVAADAAHLVAELGLERPWAMGWSGGGVPALATLALHPERFAGAISLAGYTRLDREAMRDLVPEPDKTAVRILGRSRRLFRAFFHLTRFAVLRTPGVFVRALLADADRADRLLYERDDFRALLVADQQEALRQGIDGVVADAQLSYQAGWPFEPGAVRGPVHVFQGTADTRVPPAFGEDLARLFPTATLHRVDGLGHLFPVTHACEILDVVTKA